MATTCDICCLAFTADQRRRLLCPTCGQVACRSCWATSVLTRLASSATLVAPSCFQCNSGLTDAWLESTGLPRSWLDGELVQASADIQTKLELAKMRETGELLAGLVALVRWQCCRQVIDAAVRPLSMPRLRDAAAMASLPDVREACLTTIRDASVRLAESGSLALTVLDRLPPVVGTSELVRSASAGPVVTVRPAEDDVQRVIRGTQTVQGNREAPVFCPVAGCVGTLGPTGVCPICSAACCRECQTVLPATGQHVCRPEDVASLRAIQASCKPCPNPKCGVMIFKSQGCNHMFCTSCNTAFEWSSGRIFTSLSMVHNPHLTEYLMRNRPAGEAAAGGQVGAAAARGACLASGEDVRRQVEATGAGLLIRQISALSDKLFFGLQHDGGSLMPQTQASWRSVYTRESNLGGQGVRMTLPLHGWRAWTGPAATGKLPPVDVGAQPGDLQPPRPCVAFGAPYFPEVGHGQRAGWMKREAVFGNTNVMSPAMPVVGPVELPDICTKFSMHRLPDRATRARADWRAQRPTLATLSDYFGQQADGPFTVVSIEGNTAGRAVTQMYVCPPAAGVVSRDMQSESVQLDHGLLNHLIGAFPSATSELSANHPGITHNGAMQAITGMLAAVNMVVDRRRLINFRLGRHGVGRQMAFRLQTAIARLVARDPELAGVARALMQADPQPAARPAPARATVPAARQPELDSHVYLTVCSSELHTEWVRQAPDFREGLADRLLLAAGVVTQEEFARGIFLAIRQRRRLVGLAQILDMFILAACDIAHGALVVLQEPTSVRQVCDGLADQAAQALDLRNYFNGLVDQYNARHRESIPKIGPKWNELEAPARKRKTGDADSASSESAPRAMKVPVQPRRLAEPVAGDSDSDSA